LGLGFKSFYTAWRTGLAKGDIEAQAKFVAQIFGVAAYIALTNRSLMFSRSFCNRTLNLIE